jgi:hypothetical protein
VSCKPSLGRGHCFPAKVKSLLLLFSLLTLLYQIFILYLCRNVAPCPCLFSNPLYRYFLPVDARYVPKTLSHRSMVKPKLLVGTR